VRDAFICVGRIPLMERSSFLYSKGDFDNRVDFPCERSCLIERGHIFLLGVNFFLIG
jgi:hypothetical protein